MKKTYFSIVMFVFCLTVWSQEKNIFIPPARTNSLKIQGISLPDSSKKIQLQNSLTLDSVRANAQRSVHTLSAPNRALRAIATATAEESEIVFYRRPAGTYLLSGLDFVPVIIAPAQRETPFEPYSKASGILYEWTMNNGSVDLSANVVNQDYLFSGSPNGLYYVPELTGRLGDDSASYAYGFYSYLDGSLIDRQFLATLIDGTLPMTNADRWVGGFFYFMSEGVSAFGTSAERYNGIDQTGFLTVFEKPLAPLYVKDIDVPFITKDGTATINAIPEGKTLTLNIIYLTDEWQWGDTVVTTTITRDDIIPDEQYSDAGFLHFSFDGRVDDIGMPVEETLLLDKAFAVEISGYDDLYNFVVPFSVNAELGVDGSTFGVHGNTLVSYQDEYGERLCDAFVLLNATFHCLSVEYGQDSLVVEDLGGYAAFYDTEKGNYVYGSIIYSSQPADNLDVELSDDWLIFNGFDETYYNDYNILFVNISGEPLPDSLSVRSGKVTITLDGISTSIYAEQRATGFTGIFTPQSAESAGAFAKGNDFLLTYPPAAISVSVYNVAGQLICEYKLNAGGRQTLPAANWAKGAYILKFNGSNGVLKVVK